MEEDPIILFTYTYPSEIILLLISWLSLKGG
jgi:hypothetical protein